MYIRKILFFIGVLAIISSCQKDFFQESGPGNLSFSNDSILFDTVFSSIGSATKKFIVYNNNTNPVTIENITLANTDPLNVYRINIDGFPIEQSQNIKLAANDSMFVFVEVTINPNSSQLPYLVTNKLEFETNGNTQSIELVAYGQNANFYTPMDNIFISGNDSLNFRYFSIDENTIWNNDLPHVIYGYVLIEPNATLIIEEGSQIYFHKNSGIIVGNPILGSNNDGGTLIVNGSLDNEVVFQGDRLEQWYADAPGQWDQIWMCQGSKNNQINYAIIRNGTVGIKVDTLGNSSSPTLEINNTIIENMSDIGLFAQGSFVSGHNNLISNCGRYSLVLNIGGRYNFTHSTFANHYLFGSRNTPSILINNYYEDITGTIQIRDLNEATFTNCIIDGSNVHELELQSNSLGNFNYLFDHCLLKIHPDSSLSSLNEENSIETNNDINIFNSTLDQDFMISEESPALNSGKSTTVTLDLLGNSRDNTPDIGAYERVD
ncbi:hypothetical protein N9Y90_03430 [Flavobacteriales bacterium]|nr:hypothetical protein [Flavobacteriales bacterium]